MDSTSSTPRHSLTSRISTAGNNRNIASSSSSVSSRSTASRPRVCYVCEEAEQLPTKALVGCLRCKRLWHHNCHSPPITRDLGNLQKSFTCDKCVKKANAAPSPPQDAAPMSPPPLNNAPRPSSIRCVIRGCPRVPSKDPATGKMICKNHSISEKHRLSSSRPQVAIKTARVDRSKVNTIRKPEDRELLSDYKLKRSSNKKSLKSAGFEAPSGQSNTKSDKRKSRTIETNAFMEAVPKQPEESREFGFANRPSYTNKTPFANETLNIESAKAKKQLSEWIERRYGEDLLTSLRSWLATQTNVHNHEKDWWVKLRDLFWAANTQSLIKKAIDALNKAIRWRVEKEFKAHTDIHPTVLADTRSMLQVKQGDIERAITRMENEWTGDAIYHANLEDQLEDWQACHHACGIIVPRDPEAGARASEALAPVSRSEYMIADIEDNDDDMNYEPPSPEPIMDLLDREDQVRASQKANDMEAPRKNSTLPQNISPHIHAAASESPSVGVRDTAMLDIEDHDYTSVLQSPAKDYTPIPPTTQLADITLEGAEASTGQQMHLPVPIPSLQSPVQGLAAAVSKDPEDLYSASPPRSSASNMSLKRKVDERFSSDPKKPTSKSQSPEPMDTSSSSTAPLAPNSLAGTGYTWEAPAGSLEAKRRVRSMHPEVTAEVDKWFPPPKSVDASSSTLPQAQNSLVGNGHTKKKQSKYPIPDHEFIKSQVWGNIDPTKIYPRPRMTPEQLAAKRAEVNANPPGKERKANFGIVFTERFKAERRARGCSIYHLNIREVDDTPEGREKTKNLEEMLNIEGLENYEPFSVKGIDGLCMREMVGTKVKEVVDGVEVERVKKVSELNVATDERRHLMFTFFRGY